jgi:hypothetical protein
MGDNHKPGEVFRLHTPYPILWRGTANPCNAITAMAWRPRDAGMSLFNVVLPSPE